MMLRAVIAAFVYLWLATPLALFAEAAPQPLPEPKLGESRTIAFDYLHDSDGRLTVNDVAAREDLDWQRGTSAFSHTGTGVLWLRLPPLKGVDIIDLGAMPDHATLYEAAPGAFDWRQQRTGDTIAMSERSLDDVRPAFRLSPAVTDSDVRFIRIEQPSWLGFSVRGWREADFLANAARAQAMRILILGFILAIVAYNLVVSVLARDRLFALNALTIGAFVALDLYLTGLGAAWLWPERPWISNMILPLSVAGIVVFGSRFMATMIDVGEQRDLGIRLVRGFGWFALALGVCALVVPYWILLAPLVVLALAFLLAVTSIAIRRAIAGHAQARLLLVPLGLSVVPGVVLLLLSLWAEFNIGWLRPHLLEITLMVEALCFSLVLATRMRMHRAEAIEARGALAEVRAKAAERFTGLQDQERARIAADLHDSLGHTLALVNAQFAMAQRDAKTSQEAQERIAHGLVALRGAIAETRRISHALHPRTLIHLGWHTALRTLVSEFADAQKIEAELVIECEQDRFGETAQVHLLRLVQEALSNITHHANADWCCVSVIDGAAGVYVSIEDNGKGPGNVAETGEGSLGLFSMRQRASLLGGELVVSARDPTGTIVAFTASASENDA